MTTQRLNSKQMATSVRLGRFGSVRRGLLRAEAGIVRDSSLLGRLGEVSELGYVSVSESSG